MRASLSIWITPAFVKVRIRAVVVWSIIAWGTYNRSRLTNDASVLFRIIWIRLLFRKLPKTKKSFRSNLSLSGNNSSIFYIQILQRFQMWEEVVRSQSQLVMRHVSKYQRRWKKEQRRINVQAAWLVVTRMNNNTFHFHQVSTSYSQHNDVSGRKTSMLVLLNWLRSKRSQRKRSSPLKVLAWRSSSLLPPSMLKSCIVCKFFSYFFYCQKRNIFPCDRSFYEQ